MDQQGLVARKIARSCKHWAFDKQDGLSRGSEAYPAGNNMRITWSQQGGLALANTWIWLHTWLFLCTLSVFESSKRCKLYKRSIKPHWIYMVLVKSHPTWLIIAQGTVCCSISNPITEYAVTTQVKMWTKSLLWNHNMNNQVACTLFWCLIKQS